MKVISGGKSSANGKTKIYIGRGSKFGNPYKIGVDGNRLEVIAKYKDYFYKNDDLKLAASIELYGKILVCHCSPLPCHGDIILKFLEDSETEPNLNF